MADIRTELRANGLWHDPQKDQDGFREGLFLLPLVPQLSATRHQLERIQPYAISYPPLALQTQWMN